MKYYTVSEVAEMFKKKPKTIRDWIKEGKLTASRPGGKNLLISDEDIKKFEEANGK